MLNIYQKSVADAIRELLEAFRLPGESQQINRIAETFAEYYFASEPGELKHPNCSQSIDGGDSGGEVSRCSICPYLFNYYVEYRFA
jgi:hypothetical protein